MLRIRLRKIAKAPHRLDPALMSTPIVPKTPAWKAMALAALLGLAMAPCPGHSQDLRHPLDGSFVGRLVLGHSDRGPAAAGDRELRALHLGDLCRPFRQ